MKNGRLSQLQLVDKYESSMMKAEPTTLCTISSLISYERVSCRHICKGSYSSGDLNDNEVLITVKDGTNSILVLLKDLQVSQ